MQDLNLNSPLSMPNSGPRPTPFGQPPLLSQLTPSPGLPAGAQPMSRTGTTPSVVPRPVGPPSGSSSSTFPQNMSPARPAGPPVSQPPPFGSRPPAPGSLPHSMISPSVLPSGPPPSIGVQPTGLLSGAASAPMLPLAARPSPPMSSLPLGSSQVVPPPSASRGRVSNGPQAFTGPQSSALQPPLIPPPIMASVRSPPQAPGKHSVTGGPAINAAADAPVQTLSPFSVAPQGITLPPGSLSAPRTWPMPPQQVITEK